MKIVSWKFQPFDRLRVVSEVEPRISRCRPAATRRRHRGEKASVLVLVLIVVSAMTILATGLAWRTRIEIKLAYSNAQRTRAYHLALGGIERVKALLRQRELTPVNITRICQFTDTAKKEGLFSKLKGGNPGEGNLLTYCLRDEQGYLNVNKSDSASWENIRGINKEHRACILDWIDADNDTNPGGAETDFYERLEPPYTAKNSQCITLKELLFVKTITPESYLGKSLSQGFGAAGNKKNQEFQIRFDDGDNAADLGLVNIFTVCGNGRININTAPEILMAALPGLDIRAAESILTYRKGPDRQFGTDDDGCMADANGLETLKDLTELQIELLHQYCRFDSEYFRIFSYAGLNNAFECCLMATVSKIGEQPVVVCLEKLR
jgi:type II secretory pathway component PulK